MPTALELTPADLKKYSDTLQRQTTLPVLTQAQRTERNRLLRRAAQAATLLKHEFGVRRVILFGSLAHQGWFAPDSDVDLAVEGLAADDYWQAWRRVEEIIQERPVDFIELETASNSLQKSIQRYGLEL